MWRGADAVPVGMQDSDRVVWAADVLTSADPNVTHADWLLNWWSAGGRNATRHVKDGQVVDIRPQVGEPILTGDGQPVASGMILVNCVVARCPWCAGEEGVWSANDWFWCCSCANRAVDGARISIRWNEPVADVIAILNARPIAVTRGWWPHQSLSYLRAENVANGLSG